MTHEELEKLVAYVASSRLLSFELEGGGQHLKLKMSPRATTSNKAVPLVESVKKPNVIKSPEMGIIRLTHPQQSEPFLPVGAAVKKGQIVAFVQNGDVLEGVPSEHDGVLARARVSNDDVIGFADVIFEVE